MNRGKKTLARFPQRKLGENPVPAYTRRKTPNEWVAEARSLRLGFCVGSRGALLAPRMVDDRDDLRQLCDGVLEASEVGRKRLPRLPAQLHQAAPCTSDSLILRG